MLYLGIDIGASKIAVIVASNGELSKYRFVLPCKNSFDEEWALLMGWLTGMFLKITKLKKTAIKAIGLSVSPTLDSDGNILRWPNREYWTGVNLRDLLRELFDAPVYFADDGNCAAIAEANAFNFSNMIYIGLGTGVAGGVVIRNKIWRGENNNASEFGHVIVCPDGERCRCGRFGCLQAYASGPALLRKIFGKEQGLTLNDIQTELKNNNLLAKKVCMQAAHMLAIFLINVSESMDINNVVFGGGVGCRFDYLLCKIEVLLRSAIRSGQIEPKLHTAKFLDNSSMMGALLLAKKAGCI